MTSSGGGRPASALIYALDRLIEACPTVRAELDVCATRYIVRIAVETGIAARTSEAFEKDETDASGHQ